MQNLEIADDQQRAFLAAFNKWAAEYASGEGLEARAFPPMAGPFDGNVHFMQVPESFVEYLRASGTIAFQVIA